jgi:anaerobic magnesium-protoporphyrin IX monomethyl ester cyclase
MNHNSFNILFLLPLWERELQWGKFKRGAGNNNFNYGIASIAGVLKESGFNVEIFDPDLHFFDEEQLEQYLQERDFKLIGIPCYTPTVVEVYHTARICKRALPDCKVIVGGVHPSLYPETTLQDCEAIEYVCIGEGEYLMLELADCLSHPGITKQDVHKIKGLAYRENGHVILNENRELIKNLSALPLPEYKLFELEKYRLQPTLYKKLPTYTMVASRGCPYSCSFCHIHAVLGRKARYKGVDKVLQEVEYLIKNYGARGIAFQDGTFTVNMKWIEEFCRALIKEKIKITWMCFTRVDNVDTDLLKLMKEAGCYGISFGVESFNQKSLDLMKKNVTVQQNIDTLNMALELGFYLTATYMICFPGEKEKDVLNTIETAKEMGTHIAHFFFPLPYPKTDLWELCKQDGGLREDLEWKHYSVTYNEDPIYVNPLIGREKQKKLQEYAIRSYYMQPKIIWRNLKTINTFTDIKKYAKAALAISGYWV